MCPHSYKSEYPPGIDVDPEIAEFFEYFYKTSDIPGAHDRYTDLFTKDASFIMASRRSFGREEITATRLGMWAAVASRKHTVEKVFPFGPSSNEFMLYGKVLLGLKNGAEIEVDWAGRAVVTKSSTDGRWRMEYYQVFLDTGATQAYSGATAAYAAKSQ